MAIIKAKVLHNGDYHQLTDNEVNIKHNFKTGQVLMTLSSHFNIDGINLPSSEFADEKGDINIILSWAVINHGKQ